MTLKKNELITIPNSVSIVYFKRKNIIVLKSSENLQFFKSELLLDLLILKNKCCFVTKYLSTNLSRKVIEKLITKKNKLNTQLKRSFIELNYILYKKLNLVGVGYKVFKTKNYSGNEIFLFKLGFSHFVYLKVQTQDLNVFCLKNVKLYITGNITKITQLSALIKSFKKPEVYKGKGIRFQDEAISLKQVKKK